MRAPCEYAPWRGGLPSRRREDLAPVRFLNRLVEREYERKEERRIGMWLKMSGLPPGKTLDSFRPELPTSRGSGEGGGAGRLRVHPAGGERLVPGTAGSGQESPGGGPRGEGHQERVPWDTRWSTIWKPCSSLIGSVTFAAPSPKAARSPTSCFRASRPIRPRRLSVHPACSCLAPNPTWQGQMEAGPRRSREDPAQAPPDP